MSQGADGWKRFRRPVGVGVIGRLPLSKALISLWLDEWFEARAGRIT